MKRLPTIVAIVVLVAACEATDASPPPPTEPPVTSSTAVDAGRPSVEVASPPAVGPLEAAPSTSTTLPAPEGPRCDGIPVGNDADAPPELAARIYAALLDPAWQEVDVSASVWIDGIGEVVSIGADQRLLPASNQKLFTAIGSHLLLPEDLRFTTQVLADGGSLVLRAGGDPTLRSTGTHSLAALAPGTAAAGVEQVDELVVDVRHFEAAPIATGWQDWHVPTYVGPMSALIVDDNRGRSDEVFLADPALAHLGTFAEALRAEGVQVGSTMRHVEESASLHPSSRSPPSPRRPWRSSAPRCCCAATTRSPSRSSARSETARRPTASTASTRRWPISAPASPGPAGMDRASRGRTCARPASGGCCCRSPATAMGKRAASRPAGGRAVRHPESAPRRPGDRRSVRAKTGSIIGGRSLSGYATTADGRDVVFAIVVNGDPAAAAAAVPAIDALVTAVVAG